MKKFLKFSLTSLVALILIFIPAKEAFASSAWPTGPAIESESAFVMDAYSSNVLYEKDGDAQRYPASTTKILTCILALENSTMDEIVTFSENAVNLVDGAVTIDSVAGEEMRMEDMLYGLMLPSGNDCAIAIAEHIGGSVEGFAKMMNERAKKIGATHSHFVNPNGLPDDDHYTTAHDMALIAQEAFKNSVFVKLISTPTYIAPPTNKTDEEREFKNTNMLIHPSTEYYDERVIGGKTGFTYEAGRCLVTFAKQDNMTIITVQYGGPLKEIFGEARTLYDFVFGNFSLKSASQIENRFSFASNKSKIALDSSQQILMVNSVPLSDVESTITFAKDMSDEQKNAALSNGFSDKGSKLFAVINYSLEGHNLGSVNVYNVPNLKISKASFITVNYINVVFVIIFAILILVISSVIAASKKRPAKSQANTSARTSSASRVANPNAPRANTSTPNSRRPRR